MPPPHHVPPRPLADELRLKIAAPFSVAAVGDIIMPAPLRRDDPRHLALVGRIRAADVGFGNMETSLVDWSTHFTGPVAGTLAPPAVGQAMRDMGLTLMSRANNHTFDGGVLGMIETDRRLTEAGIVHAGSGMNLQEARTARHLETPKGRVGLVSFHSLADTGHFGPTYARTEATARTGSMGGAPGVNPLHLTACNVVSPADLDRLKDIARAAYGDRPGAHETGPQGQARFRFFDQWYEAGDDPGAIRYAMDEGDRKGILDAVRSGKVYADFLIATVHSHQATRFDPHGGFGKVQGLKEPLEHDAPDFLVRMAHDCIDAGADMFVTHGIHTIAGVEIYRGCPVFYGLSNFVFQCGLQVGAGYDVMANWMKKSELGSAISHQAILAISHYDRGRLAEVRLHPADLGGPARPLSQMGIPMQPEPAVAARMLADIQSYSARFGTRISPEDGVGVIRV